MVGRINEQQRLMALANSGESEFVVVYGRRRIGKTYLVRETFDGEFTFTHSGMARVGLSKQLHAFRSSLKEWGDVDCPALQNWIDAFDELKKVIRASTIQRKIVFIDEMPWLDTPKSGFVPALENFWNGWACARKDVMLVICGSATSWIIDKVLKNKGGLHGRVTEQIHLKPFTLKECEDYAASRGLEYSRRLVLECYMVFGGVPYYWRMLHRGKSPSQDIEELFFTENGRLRLEFDELYSSLFKQKAPYIQIIKALGSKMSGMTREELLSSTCLAEGGRFGKYLDELEQCGFIRRYRMLGKSKRGTIYQLIDNFTLFYLRFIEEARDNALSSWIDNLETPRYYNWAGLAFERICLQHIGAIKHKLEIGGVRTSEYSWRGNTLTGDKVQVDLLIDRNDGIIDICEMKYTNEPYALNEEEWNRLSLRRKALREVLGDRKALHVIMVTSQPMISNCWSAEVVSNVVADDLFVTA